MVRVKMTEMGGYVMGDGDLPAGFNPDAFLASVLKKMAAKGVQEMELTNAEIIATTAIMEDKIDDTITNGIALTYNNTSPSAQELAGMLDEAMAVNEEEHAE